MSDTPRTDEFVKMAIERLNTTEAVIRFARQLEREINALKHDLERAMANHNADLN
jgi:hypothetical protein